MITKRVLPGVILAVLWISLLLYNSVFFFNMVIIAIIFGAANEYLRMSRHQPHSKPSKKEKIVLSSFFVIPVIAASIVPSSTSVLIGSMCGAFFIVLWHLYNFKADDALARAGYLLFCRDILGLLYIGTLAAHLCMLYQMPQGNLWLLIVTVITASSDTGAYFIGKAFGKRKLSPEVSPNKTIEGAVGGIITAVIFSLLASLWLFDTQENIFLFYIVGIAIILSIAGILGDLTESMIKRGTNTKDSGVLLAGHGGLLDRADSLLFAVPVLYHLLRSFYFSG